MRRALILSLMLAACDGGPTLAGGDATPPDGRLFFTRRAWSPDYNQRVELRMIDDLRRPSTPVVAGGADRRDRPAVSRDGRYLAWTSVDYGGIGELPRYGLVTFDRYTGALRQLGGSGIVVSAPSWTSDDRLVYLRADAALGGPMRLVESAPDGTGLRQLLPDGERLGSAPDVAPDGGRVVWVRGERYSQVEIIDLATRDTVHLTAQDSTTSSLLLRDPAWSPDGRRVAFVLSQFRYPDPVLSILRVVDTHGLVIAEHPLAGEVVRPAWSPDGRRIAFCRYPPSPPGGASASEIRVWRIGNDADVSITPASASECAPTWSR